jgi:hypothetical protein
VDRANPTLKSPRSKIVELRRVEGGGDEAGSAPHTDTSVEILAGSLQDNGRAEVVGETTFGAGTVLVEERPSTEGSAILLAVAKWLTPNGVAI